jgi:hypothetical protein
MARSSFHFRSSCPKILPTSLPLNIMNPQTCPSFTYSLFHHNRNQSSLYPHGLRPSRKTGIIQSLLGKVKSWVTQPIPIPWPLRPNPRTYWGWRLLPPCQGPMEERKNQRVVPMTRYWEWADTLDLRASQTCFSSMNEAGTGRSWHSLNSWFVVHW